MSQQRPAASSFRVSSAVSSSSYRSTAQQSTSRSGASFTRVSTAATTSRATPATLVSSSSPKSMEALEEVSNFRPRLPKSFFQLTETALQFERPPAPPPDEELIRDAMQFGSRKPREENSASVSPSSAGREGGSRPRQHDQQQQEEDEEEETALEQRSNSLAGSSSEENDKAAEEEEEEEEAEQKLFEPDPVSSSVAPRPPTSEKVPEHGATASAGRPPRPTAAVPAALSEDVVSNSDNKEVRQRRRNIRKVLDDILHQEQTTGPAALGSILFPGISPDGKQIKPHPRIDGAGASSSKSSGESPAAVNVVAACLSTVADDVPDVPSAGTLNLMKQFAQKEYAQQMTVSLFWIAVLRLQSKDEQTLEERAASKQQKLQELEEQEQELLMEQQQRFLEQRQQQFAGGGAASRGFSASVSRALLFSTFNKKSALSRSAVGPSASASLSSSGSPTAGSFMHGSGGGAASKSAAVVFSPTTTSLFPGLKNTGKRDSHSALSAQQQHAAFLADAVAKSRKQIRADLDAAFHVAAVNYGHFFVQMTMALKHDPAKGGGFGIAPPSYDYFVDLLPLYLARSTFLLLTKTFGKPADRVKLLEVGFREQLFALITRWCGLTERQDLRRVLPRSWRVDTSAVVSEPTLTKFREGAIESKVGAVNVEAIFEQTKKAREAAALAASGKSAAEPTSSANASFNSARHNNSFFRRGRASTMDRQQRHQHQQQMQQQHNRRRRGSSIVAHSSDQLMMNASITSTSLMSSTTESTLQPSQQQQQPPPVVASRPLSSQQPQQNTENNKPQLHQSGCGEKAAPSKSAGKKNLRLAEAPQKTYVPERVGVRAWYEVGFGLGRRGILSRERQLEAFDGLYEREGDEGFFADEVLGQGSGSDDDEDDDEDDDANKKKVEERHLFSASDWINCCDDDSDVSSNSDASDLEHEDEDHEDQNKIQYNLTTARFNRLLGQEPPRFKTTVPVERGQQQQQRQSSAQSSENARKELFDRLLGTVNPDDHEKEKTALSGSASSVSAEPQEKKNPRRVRNISSRFTLLANSPFMVEFFVSVGIAPASDIFPKVSSRTLPDPRPIELSKLTEEDRRGFRAAFSAEARSALNVADAVVDLDAADEADALERERRDFVVLLRVQRTSRARAAAAQHLLEWMYSRHHPATKKLYDKAERELLGAINMAMSADGISGDDGAHDDAVQAAITNMRKKMVRRKVQEQLAAERDGEGSGATAKTEKQQQQQQQVSPATPLVPSASLSQNASFTHDLDDVINDEGGSGFSAQQAAQLNSLNAAHVRAIRHCESVSAKADRLESTLPLVFRVKLRALIQRCKILLRKMERRHAFSLAELAMSNAREGIPFPQRAALVLDELYERALSGEDFHAQSVKAKEQKKAYDQQQLKMQAAAAAMAFNARRQSTFASSPSSTMTMTGSARDVLKHEEPNSAVRPPLPAVDEMLAKVIEEVLRVDAQALSAAGFGKEQIDQAAMGAVAPSLTTNSDMQNMSLKQQQRLRRIAEKRKENQREAERERARRARAGCGAEDEIDASGNASPPLRSDVDVVDGTVDCNTGLVLSPQAMRRRIDTEKRRESRAQLHEIQLRHSISVSRRSSLMPATAGGASSCANSSSADGDYANDGGEDNDDDDDEGAQSLAASFVEEHGADEKQMKMVLSMLPGMASSSRLVDDVRHLEQKLKTENGRVRNLLARVGADVTHVPGYDTAVDMKLGEDGDGEDDGMDSLADSRRGSASRRRSSASPRSASRRMSSLPGIRLVRSRAASVAFPSDAGADSLTPAASATIEALEQHQLRKNSAVAVPMLQVENFDASVGAADASTESLPPAAAAAAGPSGGGSMVVPALIITPNSGDYSSTKEKDRRSLSAAAAGPSSADAPPLAGWSSASPSPRRQQEQTKACAGAAVESHENWMKKFQKGVNVITFANNIRSSHSPSSDEEQQPPPLNDGSAGGAAQQTNAIMNKTVSALEESTNSGSSRLVKAASLTASSLLRMRSGRRQSSALLDKSTGLMSTSASGLPSPMANFHGATVSMMDAFEDDQNAQGLVPHRPVTARNKTQLRRSGQQPSTARKL